ncbi:MAG: hotdog fold domain-containing protein [Nocardioides sp.]|uniref:hotdog fold domain-containing protein n=1 Tax=Nocardioides sp. TaxID=35761 RepID=UPI0039E2C0B3
MPQPSLSKLWNTTTGLPVLGPLVGKRAFSVFFSQFAPYFASIHATVTVLEPNHAELVIPDKRRVHNHIGTVHAIALCNGLEMAMGALAEVTIPETKRWIPKGMTVSYTAKATGDITCVAETDQAQWDTAEGDLPVRVKGVLADGTVVIEGAINLWVTTKKSAATA